MQSIGGRMKKMTNDERMTGSRTFHSSFVTFVIHSRRRHLGLLNMPGETINLVEALKPNV